MGNETAFSKTEKLWNASYLKVMTSNFLLFFAFYILTPLLPIYLDEQFGAEKGHHRHSAFGLCDCNLAHPSFQRIHGGLLQPQTRVDDMFPVFFVCFAGYIGAGTLLMFAIVRTVHGIPFGAATVANSTVAIDVLPSSRRNEESVSTV